MLPAPSSLRVLLVDDHPILRDGLRAALGALMPGCRISEAGTGPEALAQVEAWEPCLVLVDVNLPGMNGLTLTRQIRARPNPPEVLMVAGEADPWTVHEALQAGASGFLGKTRAAQQLADAIRVVLAGGRFLCDDSAAALRRVEDSGQTGLDPPGPASLSPREREVLKRLAQGHTTKTIALELRVSPKTIETHRVHLQRKLRLDNLAALTRYAIQHGLTTV
jgi:DNA-binding NarL/FixJ family response regulator